MPDARLYILALIRVESDILENLNMNIIYKTSSPLKIDVKKLATRPFTSIIIFVNIYMYVDIYVCVCVCVCLLNKLNI